MIKVAAISILLPLLVLSCTKEKTAQLGKPHYAFNVETATRLWIIKNAEGQAPWSVQVARRRDPPPFEPLWVVDSAPHRLRDNLADGVFVEHFLDTLKTLVPRAEAKSDSLENLGLKPSRAQVEWTVQTSEDALTSYQVFLGNPVSAKDGFARYATLSGARGVYEVEGATLRMLDYAADWTTLRYKKVALWEADDVDRIEATPTHHYERAGSGWDEMKGKKKKSADNVAALLEDLMHQRVLRYLDTDEEEGPVESASNSATLTRITLKTRKGASQVLEAFSSAGKVYARNSLRGPIWFQVYPQLLETLKSLNLRK